VGQLLLQACVLQVCLAINCPLTKILQMLDVSSKGNNGTGRVETLSESEVILLNRGFVGINASIAQHGALDCILSIISPSMLQIIFTSAVVLGLPPTMLAALGPNIAESAMLSLERPTLSLQLSLGAPTASVTRILTYEDPFKSIQLSHNNSSLLGLLSPNRHSKYRWLIIAIEYTAALVTIANIIHMSIELGWRSVSSFYWASYLSTLRRRLSVPQIPEMYNTQKLSPRKSLVYKR
jgi:hypothetical protein